MRSHTIVFLILSIALLLPADSTAQVSSPGEVTEEEVRQFIDEYTKRFAKLDLEAYMALFSKEAVENKMLPYADIKTAYRRTVSHTQSIIYHLKIYSVQTYTRSALVRGRYEIIQFYKKSWNRKNLFRGDIQWNLVRENEGLKVKEINYGRDR